MVLVAALLLRRLQSKLLYQEPFDADRTDSGEHLYTGQHMLTKPYTSQITLLHASPAEYGSSCVPGQRHLDYVSARTVDKTVDAFPASGTRLTCAYHISCFSDATLTVCSYHICIRLLDMCSRWMREEL